MYLSRGRNEPGCRYVAAKLQICYVGKLVVGCKGVRSKAFLTPLLCRLAPFAALLKHLRVRPRPKHARASEHAVNRKSGARAVPARSSSGEVRTCGGVGPATPVGRRPTPPPAAPRRSGIPLLGHIGHRRGEPTSAAASPSPATLSPLFVGGSWRSHDRLLVASGGFLRDDPRRRCFCRRRFRRFGGRLGGSGRRGRDDVGIF